LLTDKYIFFQFENKDNYFFRDFNNLNIANDEIINPKKERVNTINDVGSIAHFFIC